MADLRKSRAEMKDGLTKAYGNLVVLMAEDDYEAVMSEREHLKICKQMFDKMSSVSS